MKRFAIAVVVGALALTPMFYVDRQRLNEDAAFRQGLSNAETDEFYKTGPHGPLNAEMDVDEFYKTGPHGPLNA